MATRGRKRQHDPSIPGHIDQGVLPRGVYWDRTGNGRWFVFERDVDGRAKRKTIAGREAKLSDLHRIVEERAGVDRASLTWSALLANVITPAERFSFHDLKRKGITDTPGTRADKQHASGHKTAAMLDVYDQSRPVVRPSKE